jgi:Uma2 family endonuclease
VDLPHSDGEPVESERHDKQRGLLRHCLTEGWSARRDFYVAADMALYFSELQSKRNDFRAPDVFVVLGVEPKERLSWVVWEEEGRTPDVVIEILSDSTADVDRGEKMRIYARILKVAAYYLYDPFTYELEGYALDCATGDYRRVEPNEHGRLPCAPAGLELGPWKGRYCGLDIPWLRWFETDGVVVPTAAELAAQRGEEEARRAEQEARRAEQETRRAEELAARVVEYERRFGKLE